MSSEKYIEGDYRFDMHGKIIKGITEYIIVTNGPINGEIIISYTLLFNHKLL